MGLQWYYLVWAVTHPLEIRQEILSVEMKTLSSWPRRHFCPTSKYDKCSFLPPHLLPSLPPSLSPSSPSLTPLSSSLPPPLSLPLSYRHSIALVSGLSSGTPARYLDPDDRILSVKVGAPPTAMFVLCAHMPGQALLEVIDTVRQNVRTATYL